MMPTCRFIPPTLGPEVSNSCTAVRDSIGTVDSWANYKISEYFIKELLIPMLQTQGVAVNVFLDGPSVTSPTINRWKPELTPSEQAVCMSGVDDVFPGPDECFQSFADLSKTGFRGLNAPTQLSFGSGQPDEAPLDVTLGGCGSFAGDTTFLCSDSIDEQRENFLSVNRGNPTAVFERSAPLAFDLATLTGGLFCPLRDVAPVGSYRDHDRDCDGTGYSGDDCCQAIFEGNSDVAGLTPCVYKNELRDPTSGDNNIKYLSFAQEYLPKGLQATRCARRVGTANPYIQEVPLRICPEGRDCCDSSDNCL
jgi:hypothetical protein